MNIFKLFQPVRPQAHYISCSSVQSAVVACICSVLQQHTTQSFLLRAAAPTLFPVLEMLHLLARGWLAAEAWMVLYRGVDSKQQLQMQS